MKEDQLTELPSDNVTPEESSDDLRARLERLERDSQENLRRTEQRAILAELKIEAMRANMIDLDGLRFLDMTQISLDSDGGLTDGAALIDQLKRAKPWLFAAPASSSVAKVPLSGAVRQKPVKDMSDAEYRVARENIIKRTVF